MNIANIRRPTIVEQMQKEAADRAHIRGVFREVERTINGRSGWEMQLARLRSRP